MTGEGNSKWAHVTGIAHEASPRTQHPGTEGRHLLLPGQVHHNLSSMWPDSVLKKVDALPRT